MSELFCYNISMAVTPNTDVYLLKCPIELDNANQVNFASASAQYNYFSSLPKIEAENFTYQRKDSIIRFPAHIDSILEYNYVMYRNTNYGSKWFYAFITDMTYINDNMTAITIRTDVWQTWQFDIEMKPSFIEREHVSNDAIGAHTLNENINTGEMMINTVTNKTICAPDVDGAWIAMAVTEYPTRTQTGQPILQQGVARLYNGIIQGCYLMLFEFNSQGTATLSDVIAWYDNNGKGDAITALYALPKNIYPSNAITPHSIADPFEGTFYTFNSAVGATDMGTTSISLNASLNGYTPKNNKMLCYPYNYLLVTNNAGVNNIYHYEDFITPSTVEFKYNGVVTEGSDVRAYPIDYKKNNTNFAGYNYGLSMGNTPTFSWNNDLYLNWKAQNSFQGVFNQAGRVVQAYEAQPEGGAEAPAGDVFSYFGRLIEKGSNLVGATITGIKNLITGSGHQASLVPDQVTGSSTGDLNFSIGRCGFTFYQMSVRAEMASLIDNYFSMYGYKVNTVKDINITSRRCWNYIKCEQPNILGDIPQGDMNEIKGIFTNGVTFWHDPATFLDYSQTNNIV